MIPHWNRNTVDAPVTDRTDIPSRTVPGPLPRTQWTCTKDDNFRKGVLPSGSQLLGTVAEQLHPWDGERCVVETVTAAAAFQVERKANRD